jgi:hypothetical protein
LDDLSNKIGSVYQDLPVPKAVLYTKAQLETLGLDRISSGSDGAQMGERRKETAYIQDNKTKITVPICALGGSVATAKTGLTEEVMKCIA